jgi:hypothetical protein
VRTAALRNAMKKYQELHSQPPAQANEALATYLKSLPEFAAAGATRDGTWALFKDGKLAVLVNNPLIDKAIAARKKHAALEAPKPHPILAAAVAGGELPTGKQFRAYDVIGLPETASALSDVSGWLSAQGYTSGGGTGLVEDMTFGNDDGVLYLNTHGAMAVLRDRDHGTILNAYAMETATPVHDEDGNPITTNSVSGFEVSRLDPPQYEAWLADGHLAYLYASIASGTEWNYAITSKWIQDFWKFGPGSFAMLAVCSSMGISDPTSAPGALVATTGLSVGWSAPVLVADGLGAARYSFDRLLGTNKMSDWEPLKTPKERPWDWLEVYGEIFAIGKGTSVDATHSATLMAVGSDVILAPSISTIDVEESAKQFILHGAFGSDSGNGQVTVSSSPGDNDNGTALSGCSWQPDTIKCTVDGQQAGYVRAVSRGHKSNPIAVTRFHPKLTWHLHHAGAKDLLDLNSVMDIIMRVDVQAYRRHATEDPKPRDPFRVAPSQDSKCTFDSSGYGTDANGNKVNITGSKSGDVIGPFATVVPTAADQMMTQLIASSGVPLPAGMPDPRILGGQAEQGKCVFGGLLDPKVGTTFQAAVALAGSIVVPGAPAAAGGFSVVMFEKKGSQTEVIKHLTLNMALVTTSDQGGPVTLKGDHLEMSNKDTKVTLDWSDTSGDFPPDPQSAR